MDTATTIDARHSSRKSKARQKTPEKATLLPKAAELRERNVRLIALLHSFELGNTEQQRQDLAALQAGVEEARPGQRRVFGEGINP